jgi:hypothetical protein
MQCATVKEGVFCSFMTPSGCGYNGGRCYTIVETCQGCDRIKAFATGEYCTSYPNPAVKWEFGKCNFATHIKVEKAEQKKLNPLKASKRAAGK